MKPASDVLVVETENNPVVSIIWAHGLGADKHDFESIIPMLDLPANLPIRFIFPNAPVRPITVNGGMEMRGWYDIRSTSINEQEDKAGIQASAEILSTLIDQQIEAGIPASNIILAGFSQGGAVALYQGLRQAQQLAGIIVLSSYLPLPDTLDAEISRHYKSIPVFIGHGNQDPIVPVELGLFTRDLLLQRKMKVQFKMYPMGHSVSVDEISDLGHWIKELKLH
jgi:phospholipase/carboxylesterase